MRFELLPASEAAASAAAAAHAPAHAPSWTAALVAAAAKDEPSCAAAIGTSSIRVVTSDRRARRIREDA